MPKGVKMEKYRPKIHFSAEDYIINDPNGLVYYKGCLLYTSDAADDGESVDLGGRRIIKKTIRGNA